MKFHPVDYVVGIFSPGAALKRWRHRQALQAVASYEGATHSDFRKNNPDNRDGDSVVGLAGDRLRGYARQLEQNYDVAKGVLDVLVNNTVGPDGINCEPMPKDKDGNIHKEFSKQLLQLWNDWIIKPEVTWCFDYAATERLACRTWFRDGEVLAQMLEGTVPMLDHGTRVPFSLELVEADLLSPDSDESKNITQGVERNAWGRPRAYHLLKVHPGSSALSYNTGTRRVSADRWLHPKITSRIGQARGVSVFASVMIRLEDLKDYEESERIAARVAAALTGYIKKGTVDDWEPPAAGATERQLQMSPGMIADKLQPGEDIGTIDSNRPSSLLEPFHQAMTRRVASGTGTGYSSISRHYDGNYSAQRQELVESWLHYRACTNLFVGQFRRPVHQRFVSMAILSGAITVPDDVDMATIYDADFRGPAMPWIDPVKEANGYKIMERCGYISAQQIIRGRGGNPSETMNQVQSWRQDAADKKLQLDSDPANDGSESASASAAADGGNTNQADIDNNNT